jgi:hypothetical protein
VGSHRVGAAEIVEDLDHVTGRRAQGACIFRVHLDEGRRVPGYGNDCVMAALVNKDKELRISRQVDKTSPVWQVIYRPSRPTAV